MFYSESVGVLAVILRPLIQFELVTFCWSAFICLFFEIAQTDLKLLALPPECRTAGMLPPAWLEVFCFDFGAGLKSRALCMSGKSSATELHPQPCSLKIGSLTET